MKNKRTKRTPRHITLGSYVSDNSTSLIVLLTICTIYSFICLTKNCFSSAMVFIVDEGVLTKSQTGTITGAFYIAYAILQLVGGALADGFGWGVTVKVWFLLIALGAVLCLVAVPMWRKFIKNP